MWLSLEDGYSMYLSNTGSRLTAPQQMVTMWTLTGVETSHLTKAHQNVLVLSLTARRFSMLLSQWPVSHSHSGQSQSQSQCTAPESTRT